MFTILNRLRGTVGAWSKFNGLLLAYIIYALTCNHYVALRVGIGYQTAKLWDFKYMHLGWEHQDVWYRLFQDVVIISLLFML